MRIAKATFALACALAAIAAPTAAYAVPQNTVIMPGDTIKAKYLVATSTCTAAAPVRDNHGVCISLPPGIVSTENWEKLLASPSTIIRN